MLSSWALLGFTIFILIIIKIKTYFKTGKLQTESKKRDIKQVENITKPR